MSWLRLTQDMLSVSVKELIEIASARSEREMREEIERVKLCRGQPGRLPYYTKAKASIREFHAGSHHAEWLVVRAAGMRRDSQSVTGWRRGDLMRCAARLEDWRVHFGRRVLSVETAPRLGLVCGGVRVTSSPDIVAREGDVRKLLRLEMRDYPPSELLAKTVPVVLFTAAVQYGFSVRPADAEYVYVHGGQVFVASNVSRVMNMVERICTDIRRFW